MILNAYNSCQVTLGTDTVDFVLGLYMSDVQPLVSRFSVTFAMTTLIYYLARYSYISTKFSWAT